MTVIDRITVFHQKQKGPVKLTTRSLPRVPQPDEAVSKEAATGAPSAATPPCLRKSRRFISYLRSSNFFKAKVFWNSVSESIFLRPTQATNQQSGFITYARPKVENAAQ